MPSTAHMDGRREWECPIPPTHYDWLPPHLLLEYPVKTPPTHPNNSNLCATRARPGVRCRLLNYRRFVWAVRLPRLSNGSLWLSLVNIFSLIAINPFLTLDDSYNINTPEINSVCRPIPDPPHIAQIPLTLGMTALQERITIQQDKMKPQNERKEPKTTKENHARERMAPRTHDIMKKRKIDKMLENTYSRPGVRE